MFDLQAKLLKNAQEKPGMPLVMGVLNVTPDSFSDGGQFQQMDTIERRVQQMVEEGVDIIDVGGESTRPGADKVSLDVELGRVAPVIHWISERFDVPVSIDTYKAEVMQEAIKQGADIVNDVNALQAEGAIELVAETGVTTCLMHKKGSPKDMQKAPEYGDVVEEVIQFLIDRAEACQVLGVEKNRIILDPGFGFGKTLAHNTELFSEMDRLVEEGYPLLVGVSRKRMIGEILNGLPVEERVHGSVSAAVLAGLKGAQIVRVHDVAPTVQALKTVSYLL